MTDKQTVMMLSLVNEKWLQTTSEVLEYCTDKDEARNILMAMNREIKFIEKLIEKLES